jgi:hypothetical protein
MSMHSNAGAPPAGSERTSRVYCLCLFQRGAVVPEVKLIDADGDDEAVSVARATSPACERELWDRHRLVAHFPPATGFLLAD